MEKLEDYLNGFADNLDRLIKKIWELEDFTGFQEAMITGAEILSQQAADIGDFCLFSLQEKRSLHPSQELDCYLIQFVWADGVKFFLILWRDILLQYQKAEIMFLDGVLAREAIQTLRQQSRKVLEEAAGGLIGLVEKEKKVLRSEKNGSARKTESWRLQKNPWPLFKEQIAVLPQQCRELQSRYQDLSGVLTVFHEIEQKIRRLMEACTEELHKTRELAQRSVAHIEDIVSHKKENQIRRLGPWLEDVESQVLIPHHLKIFSEELDRSLEVLPARSQPPVDSDQGLLLYKELNFQRAVRQWLESEVLPVLYEFWELTENASNGLKMSVINIRNRTILLTAGLQEGQSPDFEKSELCQPLHIFLKNLLHSEEEMSALSDLVLDRLGKEFRFSAVFDAANDFLPVPIQSTINQFRQNQNQLLVRARKWLRNQAGIVQSLRQMVRKEESLSVSEKIVRYLQSRTADITNTHYSSIFLTKGYIGESFWVGRETELNHLEWSIDNWRQGFPGAVAITGTRFSGKSLLGELVANRFFSNETLALYPNTNLHLKGRRMKVGYDLGAVLDFIRKYTLNTRMLVWIDDLELWSDPTVPLGKNVRALQKHVDDQANRLFFLIAMGNSLKVHLDRHLDLSKTFQTEINVDRMSLKEIREAILIRHGATHKTLVDDTGKEATPLQFRQMVRKINQFSSGNIGEALNVWTYFIHKLEEETVVCRPGPAFNLPEFMNPDISVVLSAIMLEKRTNEYRLRKLFGPAFTDRYAGVVQRLLSVGVLRRQMDGWLEINEVVVNEAGRMLESNGYLKYES